MTFKKNYCQPIYDSGGSQDNIRMPDETHAVPLFQQIVHRPHLLHKFKL
jgi:hypothetical protein